MLYEVITVMTTAFAISAGLTIIMTEMLYTPKSEIDARIRFFQADLAQQGLDGALIVITSYSIHYTKLYEACG